SWGVFELTNRVCNDTVFPARSSFFSVSRLEAHATTCRRGLSPFALITTKALYDASTRLSAARAIVLTPNRIRPIVNARPLSYTRHRGSTYPRECDTQ